MGTALLKWWRNVGSLIAAELSRLGKRVMKAGSHYRQNSGAIHKIFNVLVRILCLHFFYPLP